MTVLTGEAIKELVENDALIENFDKDSLEGASYDMRMGSHYVLRGQTVKISDESPSIVIEPGDFIILSTFEVLNMPKCLVGHNGIMSPWAKRGIVSLFSPQIDPGFEGFLVVPIFNAGDAAVTINFLDKIFTVEFLRTDRPASYAWTDRFPAQRRIPQNISAPTKARPNLTDISEVQKRLGEIEKHLAKLEGLIEKRTFNLGKAALWVTILLGIGALILSDKVQAVLGAVLESKMFVGSDDG